MGREQRLRELVGELASAVMHPDAEPVVADLARIDVLSWLQDGAGRTYGRPTPDQAADIAAGLAHPALTSQQQREIAFVAGIRP